MAVVLKKGNGILYFIIAVVVLALGTCVFFMVEKDAPATSGGATFSTGGTVLDHDDHNAQKPDEKGSVLGLDKTDGTGSEKPAESVLDAEETKVKAADKEEKKAKEPDKQVSSIVQKMIDEISGYFAASSPDQRLAYVIDPEKVASKMKAYYSRVPMRSGKIARVNVPVGMALGGFAYWRAQGTMEDGTPFFIALRMVDGKPKIDWESEVRYSDFDWDEWVDDPAAKVGEFRVYAKVDGVYEDPYEDNSRYRCLYLKSMDSSRSLFAYLDMNDFDQSEFYNTISSANGGPLECLLKLEKTKGKDGKQPKISTAKVLKVLSPSWINPGTLDD